MSRKMAKIMSVNIYEGSKGIDNGQRREGLGEDNTM
jgi:hypothetical protein